MTMITAEPGLSTLSEHELRRQIDRSVSRALVDHAYARDLLADPTVVLKDRGCTPQQYLELRSIKAKSVSDFAAQAMALFWAQPYSSRRADQRGLAAAAI